MKNMFKKTEKLSEMIMRMQENILMDVRKMNLNMMELNVLCFMLLIIRTLLQYSILIMITISLFQMFTRCL